MASKPGILTEWPWTRLGKYKFVVLAPWVVHSIYTFTFGENKNLNYVLIFPVMLWRILHNLIWISLSRHWTAKGKSRILDRSIEFEQVDRETNWDDQIILNAMLFYLGYTYIEGSSYFPFWRTDGILLTILLHTGPVEFLYYWLHRALHHHYLYSRYHSHHHSSIVTEPITSVIHPFAEHLMYYALFTIPLYTSVVTRTASIVSFVGYVTYIDLMNNLGHCNFEFLPKKLFQAFPFLKYIMYTPSYHSLHHTQFRINYSLFMPIYDYIYGTMDKNSDSLYEASLNRQGDTPDVVHLTHPTTLDSIYHLRIGFASVASNPYTSRWYMWAFWPLTLWFLFLTRVSNTIFIVERHMFNKLKMQTWAVPRYSFQYTLPWQRESINKLIEEAILEAEKAGVKVFSLGLLNQVEELNKSGELYIHKHPNLKTRLVDGSSLAVAVVLNSIPKGTKEVLFKGNLTKVAYTIAIALCKSGVQVWLVGDGLKDEEQKKAAKGTVFIPFSQFPPPKMRKDCIYRNTPAMLIPKALENMHSCENWLPRRVMSAWRVAGIVHVMENWDSHECGNTMLNIEKVWTASLRQGFRPLVVHA